MTYRYQIKGWDDYFETAKTRKLQHPYWVSVPTKQGGQGMTRILVQEDGAAIFGIWILIVQACSQHRFPRAGWLTNDGTPEGDPWTIEDMAERWRRPIAEVARALDVLCSPRVGWIDTYEDESHTSATHPPLISHRPLITCHPSPTVEVSRSQVEVKSGESVAPPPEDLFSPDPIGRQPTQNGDPWPYEQSQQWVADLGAVGCKVYGTNWRAWKRLVEKYGVAHVIQASASVPADIRWADKTEVALSKPYQDPARADAIRRRQAQIDAGQG